MEKYATIIKEKLNEGKVLCGVAVSLSDSVVSELIGISGYDFIWIEGEHSALDRKDIQQHMIAAHAGGAASLVRLVNSDPDLVKPIMDMGTDIICFPFINTVQDAQKAVAACTYPPNGIRGYNPQRASYYGNMNYFDYVKNANNETLKMMLIEQKAGYDNLEEIVKVEGIDIIALGPGDLSLDMGFSGYMNRIEIKDMISHAAEICKKYKMPFIIFPTIEKKSIEEWVNIGANMLCFAQDTTFITYVINQLLSFYNEIVPIQKQH
ncbi:TPA: 2,4-dihydroxyhept-2-ene-1,7-dioic acid aldolase [Clostridioides difficile]|nr:aldolase/citrate lyase family protein [Clostridioides difficile]MDK3207868.1 aldolase/citrate lyase family protein [Clostridioides difficile]HBF4489278.1 2,4-dihydroxyhept-2-ene-1,7-dioic acid aldolase [Clostridioides difficile]HBF4537246.1 2,4-dihydroxyhept-2-ene-1,7-dioic acid aldolase [Clostridioides difficile]HBF4841216.1 2,4-dihydroxyhept-2-ene-1,7-dioic acid aldolase [Clostridioides difficile]